jgi:hypothetical protein
MTTNVIRFPKSKRVSWAERLAARRAYRKGMEALAAKAIETAFRESANISGAEDILLKDARLLFVASVRRALNRSIT